MDTKDKDDICETQQMGSFLMENIYKIFNKSQQASLLILEEVTIKSAIKSSEWTFGDFLEVDIFS